MNKLEELRAYINEKIENGVPLTELLLPSGELDKLVVESMKTALESHDTRLSCAAREHIC